VLFELGRQFGLAGLSSAPVATTSPCREHRVRYASSAAVIVLPPNFAEHPHHAPGARPDAAQRLLRAVAAFGPLLAV